MTVNVAIVGLGQIGTSIGLALAEHTASIHRAGHDIKPDVTQKAKSLGALDSTHYNLPSMISEADIVLLCLPFDQVDATLKLICQDLREKAVVMDFSPLKAPVARWFKEYAPEGRHLVGIAPALGPDHIHETGFGPDAARADLFQKGLLGIAAPHATPESAINVASNLAKLLGATPLFMDMEEADGLMNAVHILPQLVSVSVLNTIIEQPGWSESRKLAGRPFYTASMPAQDDSLALIQEALSSRENTLRNLDTVIAALQGLRQSIDEQSEERVGLRIREAITRRADWLTERHSANWSTPGKDEEAMPDFGNVFQRLLGINSGKKKK